MDENEYWPRFASIFINEGYIVRTAKIKFERQDLLELDLIAVKFLPDSLLPIWTLAETTKTGSDPIIREIFILESIMKYYSAQYASLVFRSRGIQQSQYDFAEKRNIHLIPIGAIEQATKNDLSSRIYDLQAEHGSENRLHMLKHTTPVTQDPLKNLRESYYGLWAINNPFNRVVASEALLISTVQQFSVYLTPEYRIPLSWLIKEVSVIRMISLMECASQYQLKRSSLPLNQFLIPRFEGQTIGERLMTKAKYGEDYGEKLFKKYGKIIEYLLHYPKDAIELLNRMNHNTYLDEIDLTNGLNHDFLTTVNMLTTSFEKSKMKVG